MATSPPILNRGLPGRALPPINQDSQNNDVASRLDRYGGTFVTAPIMGKYPWVEEGTYWRTGTPTLGTGVSYTIQAAFSNTVPMLFVNNQSTNQNLWIDYLKLITTVAGASGTTFQYGCQIDTAFRTITTNHLGNGTVVGMNLGQATATLPLAYYQNNATASAINAPSGAAINSAEGAIGGISIVGDEYAIEFGREQLAGTAGLTAAQATDPGRKVSSGPPQLVPPNGSWCFYLWMANNAATALSYSFELCGRVC